jgi:hypothetical protein
MSNHNPLPSAEAAVLDQDRDRGLTDWHASKPGAKRLAREAAAEIAANRVMQESGFCRAGGQWLHPFGGSISVDVVRALTQAVVSAA